MYIIVFWYDDINEDEVDKLKEIEVDLVSVVVSEDLLLKEKEDDVSLIDFSVGVLPNKYVAVVFLKLLIKVLLVDVDCDICEG